MVFSGFEIGIALPYPAASIERDYGYVPHHPLAEAYIRYNPPPHNRPTWDLTSVLYAVLADRGYFDVSPRGTVTVESDGSTRFEETRSGNHAYLILRPEQKPRVLEALVQLSSQPPRPLRGITAMTTRSIFAIWSRSRSPACSARPGAARARPARRVPRAAAAASTPAKSSRPRIALIMKSLANEFFKTMAEGAKKHQGEHSAEYELIVNGIKDERDLSRQVALVDEMIAQHVDAIVIAPADSKALVSACKRAQEAGIAVVNIDNKLDAQVLAEQSVKVPFVGPDNREGAKMVGAYVAGKLKPGDQVGMLEGIKTAFNGQQRKLGFEDAAKDAGLKIVDSQSALWEIEPANKIASAMIGEHPEIKALLCCNDSMALARSRR